MNKIRLKIGFNRVYKVYRVKFRVHLPLTRNYYRVSKRESWREVSIFQCAGADLSPRFNRSKLPFRVLEV